MSSFAPEDVEVLERAVEVFGKDAQLTHAQEELAELIVAISHVRRGRMDERELAREIADVRNVTRTLELFVGTHAVHNSMRAKLERLERRVEAAEP